MRIYSQLVCVGVLGLSLLGCSDGSDNGLFVAPDDATVFTVANGCFAISPDAQAGFITASSSEVTYDLSADRAEDASRFLLRPSDLDKYLLYDENGGYLVSDGLTLQRQMSLTSDISEVDGKVVVQDRLQSEGEWQLLAAANGRFLLQHIKSGTYIGQDGAMVAAAEAAELSFVEQTACAAFPELSVDATGDVTFTEFEDGSVFGFVETHAHLFTNEGFGGGGVFHGAPFHPLGVEHALPSCELNHGVDGRKDIMGAVFADGVDLTALVPIILSGSLAEKDHDTDGYPTFTSWPDAPRLATHQVQYYKWIERAYLSGLRLLVQHATTNQVLCQLVTGLNFNPKRNDCNDMVAVDRIIEATYALERYIDALSGGPGQGWFRIVFSPAEAREQIKAGNLAVVLGIETSDLFDCFHEPFGNFTRCTQQDVLAKLDEYQAKGVRVLFPVHKFDNAFSAGDGDRRVGQIGSFLHTGYFSDFVECPAELLTFPGGFDDGNLNFPKINNPRPAFESPPPPVDVSALNTNPLAVLLPNIGFLDGGPLVGDYCQKYGLTDLGEFLIREMMKRGMIIEVDHLPRKSYARAYEILEANDYPAMGTHGRNNKGRLYKLGGMAKSNFGRCRKEGTPATMDDGFQGHIQLMRDNGAFPAEGFGFDLNGFAGAPGPRFPDDDDEEKCADPQTDEGITYPFTSYAGDITLQQPVVGNRTLDFNTEGMVHLGLVAELIEDVRRDGVTDKELEPLFKSAEGYLRMWEKSERRGAELSQQ